MTEDGERHVEGCFIFVKNHYSLVKIPDSSKKLYYHHYRKSKAKRKQL
jgi:hypothetical protein